MELLKLATEWAKDEVFSSKFFIFFGILFLLATLGFWQLGKTDVAKAFIYPTLVAGSLLLTIGFGLWYSNATRIKNFKKEYNTNAIAFKKAEIERAAKTVNDFKLIVFKVIPLIIVAAALLIIFTDKPIWRAISITTIAMMIVILLIDSNSSQRILNYHNQLIALKK